MKARRMGLALAKVAFRVIVAVGCTAAMWLLVRTHAVVIPPWLLARPWAIAALAVAGNVALISLSVLAEYIDTTIRRRLTAGRDPAQP